MNFEDNYYEQLPNGKYVFHLGDKAFYNDEPLDDIYLCISHDPEFSTPYMALKHGKEDNIDKYIELKGPTYKSIGISLIKISMKSVGLTLEDVNKILNIYDIINKYMKELTNTIDVSNEENIRK